MNSQSQSAGFEYDIDDGVLHIRFNGRLDHVSIIDIIEEVTALVENSSKLVLVEMCKVSYISSAGIRLLITLNSSSSNSGGKCAIATSSQQVIETLKLTGILKTLKLFPDEASALKYLKPDHH